ncbi:5-oxoprolinase subunit B family protein [Vibrio panuliri]|uniref:Allophanate hydrolase n=1 Tax=Vibrio panuliri TaxID=1381081 RepID=A0ABX3FF89_9VIBR|nr:allophanate hydrolase subunit 1 [Vibrio panuliri]OLQ91480.1 allophanate hydrolase [Vibrio panuliri]
MNALKQVNIEPVAECALLVTFETNQPQQLPFLIGSLTAEFYHRWHHVIMNITPASQSILVDYLPHRISFEQLSSYLRNCIEEHAQVTLNTSTAPAIKLPVYYALEVGPDIHRYQQNHIELDELIELHTQLEYTVEAIGFAPGFAFMSDVHSKLRLPRLTTPRLMVPKGSVAIAESRTAVYPSDSPGGWNIIGNCPINLYQPEHNPITPLQVGSRVQFYAVDRNEFVQLGGKLSRGFE